MTQLNGNTMYINADLIEVVESTPDTVITLTTGRKFIVKESAEEIVKRVVEFATRVRNPVTGQGKEAEKWTSQPSLA